MANVLPDNAPATALDVSAKLNAVQRPDAEALRLMLLLEVTGKGVYEDLAGEAGDPRVAALLRANAREEMAHAHRLRKALKILSGVDYEVPSTAENPYRYPQDGVAVTADLLRSMAASERGGESLYKLWADHAPSPEIAKLFLQNAAEEGAHGARLEEAADVMAASGAA